MSELVLEGRVVIVQSDTDPGDMGEPRVVEEDGVTYVTVPSFALWADLEEERLAVAMDGTMADYLAASPDQAFGWWAAPRVLERYRKTRLATTLRGLAPGLTGGVGSGEYVRRMRDELEDRIQADRRSWPTRIHDGAYQRVLDILRDR